jgi:hypothetical protein
MVRWKVMGTWNTKAIYMKDSLKMTKREDLEYKTLLAEIDTVGSMKMVSSMGKENTCGRMALSTLVILEITIDMILGSGLQLEKTLKHI